MSRRLLDRSVTVLANRLDRRAFIGRTAIVASAVVAAPVTYALRPSSAYAAVCRCNGSGCVCGSLCCDGYTEMCCTLTGSNSCPAGSVVAGWWKVDGSQFCGGQARYYMDCNAQCGSCGGSGGTCAGSCSGTGCGCAQGNCNNRKAGCTRFRYGQCHQELPFVGPIVCRVVTCTPPWVVDPSCGTSSRTDNNTRNHDRACLREPFGGVDAIWTEGAEVVTTGWAIAQDGGGPTCDVIVSIDLIDAARTPATADRPDIAAIFPHYGGARGYGVRIPTGYGTHLVCVRAVDIGNGSEKFLGVAHVDVGNPGGTFDGVVALGGGQIQVIGWAVDPALGQGPATVRITVDGVIVSEVPANVDRTDVGLALPALGALHGFAVTLAVAPGSHQVCVSVLGARGGEFNIGCLGVEAT